MQWCPVNPRKSIKNVLDVRVRKVCLTKLGLHLPLPIRKKAISKPIKEPQAKPAGRGKCKHHLRHSQSSKEDPKRGVDDDHRDVDEVQKKVEERQDHKLVCHVNMPLHHRSSRSLSMMASTSSIVLPWTRKFLPLFALYSVLL